MSTHSWPEPGDAIVAGHLEDLDEEACWQLLESRVVGRLAWMGPHGLSVVPLNFEVREGHIEARTAAYSGASHECDHADVAFQVDDVDGSRRSGWSVLVRGVGRVDYAFQRPDIDVWPAGVRTVRLIIDPRSISGRRLLPNRRFGDARRR